MEITILLRCLFYPFADMACGGWPKMPGRAEYYLLVAAIAMLLVGYNFDDLFAPILRVEG